ncbi:hypothetical protein FACS1894126_0260 [Alphaproteobacteria bacterium]|nr:hypothetical protein FACS1894126_0260 [Alphaproteobacteria bacterium]
MKNFLTNIEREELKKRHRTENDGRTRDRIKAVLLSDQGWSYRHISEALFWDASTVSKHVDEYLSKKKLSLETGGSESKLTSNQASELIKHLETKTYATAGEIRAYVEETYSVKYSDSGIANWLKVHGFSYRKPAVVPAKANPAEQAKFIRDYDGFKKNAKEDDVILFLDAVHPTMATKVSNCWIKKGSDKTIGTTASRTRMNIIGALELAEMTVHTKDYETINSEFMVDFFDFLIEQYPGKKIYIILDNGAYNASSETRNAAKAKGIILIFLPTYSPNLNPIERLWKVMNKYTRNNRFFKTATEFRDCIKSFFKKTWGDIAQSMRACITDKFQAITKPNFST